MIPNDEIVRYSAEELPLDPPITDEEKTWWKVKRRDFASKMVLRQGLPMFLVITIGAILAKPEKLLTVRAFWFISMMLVLSALGTWMLIHFQERNQREAAVRWKRIRETLAGGEDGDA